MSELDFAGDAFNLVDALSETSPVAPEVRIAERALNEAAAKGMGWALRELVEQPNGAADRIHAMLLSLQVTREESLS